MMSVFILCYLLGTSVLFCCIFAACGCMDRQAQRHRLDYEALVEGTTSLTSKVTTRRINSCLCVLVFVFIAATWIWAVFSIFAHVRLSGALARDNTSVGEAMEFFDSTLDALQNTTNEFSASIASASQIATTLHMALPPLEQLQVYKQCLMNIVSYLPDLKPVASVIEPLYKAMHSVPEQAQLISSMRKIDDSLHVLLQEQVHPLLQDVQKLNIFLQDALPSINHTIQAIRQVKMQVQGIPYLRNVSQTLQQLYSILDKQLNDTFLAQLEYELNNFASSNPQQVANKLLHVKHAIQQVQALPLTMTAQYMTQIVASVQNMPNMTQLGVNVQHVMTIMNCSVYVDLAYDLMNISQTLLQLGNATHVVMQQVWNSNREIVRIPKLDPLDRVLLDLNTTLWSLDCVQLPVHALYKINQSLLLFSENITIPFLQYYDAVFALRGVDSVYAHQVLLQANQSIQVSIPEQLQLLLRYNISNLLDQTLYHLDIYGDLLVDAHVQCTSMKQMDLNLFLQTLNRIQTIFDQLRSLSDISSNLVSFSSAMQNVNTQALQDAHDTIVRYCDERGCIGPHALINQAAQQAATVVHGIRSSMSLLPAQSTVMPLLDRVIDLQENQQILFDVMVVQLTTGYEQLSAFNLTQLIVHVNDALQMASEAQSKFNIEQVQALVNKLYDFMEMVPSEEKMHYYIDLGTTYIDYLKNIDMHYYVSLIEQTLNKLNYLSLLDTVNDTILYAHESISKAQSYSTTIKQWQQNYTPYFDVSLNLVRAIVVIGAIFVVVALPLFTLCHFVGQNWRKRFIALLSWCHLLAAMTCIVPMMLMLPINVALQDGCMIHPVEMVPPSVSSIQFEHQVQLSSLELKINMSVNAMLNLYLNSTCHQLSDPLHENVHNSANFVRQVPTVLYENINKATFPHVSLHPTVMSQVAQFAFDLNASSNALESLLTIITCNNVQLLIGNIRSAFCVETNDTTIDVWIFAIMAAPLMLINAYMLMISFINSFPLRKWRDFVRAKLRVKSPNAPKPIVKTPLQQQSPDDKELEQTRILAEQNDS